MNNIEIKTPVRDLASLLRHVDALGAEFTWEHRQRDVFFHVREGYLKLRLVADEPPELIAYAREPGTKPRPSDYDIARGGDGVALETALTRSLGVRGVVEKTRRLYVWEHTRLHIDEVAGLGTFLELETVVRDITMDEARAETDRVIAALKLDAADFLDRPYLELLEGVKRWTRDTPVGS